MPSSPPTQIIPHSLLNKTLQRATEMSFNRITVDGDTSTNDMVLVLANGKADNALLKENSPAYTHFYNAFEHVLTVLSKLIVKDGEGATKFIEVTVKGSQSEKEAEASGTDDMQFIVSKNRYSRRRCELGENSCRRRQVGDIFQSGQNGNLFRRPAYPRQELQYFFLGRKSKKNSSTERNYDNRRPAWRQSLRNVMDMRSVERLYRY